MILQSLLDTDLYKFSMMQAVLHQYPGAHAEYRFKCRTPGVDLAQYIDEISAEIDHLCSLRLTCEELEYLRSLRYIKSDFVDFLELFVLQRRHIHLQPSTTVPGELDLSVKGPWLHTILFEVPILAIISEVWMRHNATYDPEEGERRLRAKLAPLQAAEYRQCTISDFGTRRRFSRAWHERLIPLVKEMLGPQFVGTSNIDLARRYNVTPHGTMAHEWLQAHQALGPRLRDSQKAAFQAWAQEYRGDLGIALSDVVGIDAFLTDFDLYFCKLFDGMRHDSGDPVVWGERVLAHLRGNRVDTHSKALVFSDGLDIPTVMRLYDHFKEHCRPAFGVGTNLTNDIGAKPLQIVLKMVACNGQPVAKISDTPGKSMCDDPGYLRYLRQVFGLPAETEIESIDE